MKTGWTSFLMAAVAMAVSGAAQHEPDVMVYLHRWPITRPVIGLAEGEARDILGSAGISLEFVLGPRRGGSDRGRDRGTSGCAIQPGSLKFATLGTNASTRIEILYNAFANSGATMPPDTYWLTIYYPCAGGNRAAFRERYHESSLERGGL
jgi:hypothetical protein